MTARNNHFTAVVEVTETRIHPAVPAGRYDNPGTGTPERRVVDDVVKVIVRADTLNDLLTKVTRTLDVHRQEPTA